MFKEKYKKANDSISLSPSSKKYIRSKLTESQEKAPRPFRKNAVVATCLSLALVLCVVFAAGSVAPVFQSPAVPKALVTKLTYGDLYDQLSGIFDNRTESEIALYGFAGLTTGTLARDDVGALTDSVDNINEAAPGDTSDAGSKGSSSSTNTQVAGVDEADIVKNDGRYIYALSGGYIHISDSNNGDPVWISKIRVSSYGFYVKDFYVKNDRLAVIQTPMGYDNVSAITICCLDNKEKPFVMATVKQSGYAIDSRMVGDTVYLISNYSLYSKPTDKDAPEQYVPCINGRAMPIDDISMVEGSLTPEYLVVTATNIVTAQSTTGESVLGAGETVYCSKDNLYYTFSEYNKKTEENSSESRNSTTVVKLSLSPEDIKTVAGGCVEGVPLNQFSMDEYKGNLRIVTTVDVGRETTSGSADSSTVSWNSTTENALFVLDKNMKVIGSVSKLAEGERVKSVRFDGPTGYFVTFRQVDPLFTVDLSDPKHPTVLSELKIPGFSEYLHPFSKGLLFGFGMDATEEGFATSVKLSMFDVSDPSDVSEADTLPLEDVMWSAASYNHKAIMVDAEKNIIAFCGEGIYGESFLLVFGYDAEQGFTEKANISIGKGMSFNTRFMWIDDYFYAVNEFGITAFDLATFTENGKLEF